MNDVPQDQNEKNENPNRLEGESEEGALARLSKNLYSKKAGLPDYKRFRFRSRKSNDEKEGAGWTSPSQTSLGELYNKEVLRMSFTKKFFIASILFFTIATVAFFFVFVSGTNSPSPEKVSILIQGPVSVEAGKDLSLQIVIENRNDVSLENATLTISYPEGSRTPNDTGNVLSRTREDLGDVRSGGIVNTSKDMVLFGGEGAKKTVIVQLEYRFRDSNAILVGEKEYNVFISASPLILRLDTLREVNAGKEFVTEMTITSNSNKILSDILVHVDYPFGFSYVDASPAPAYGNDTWYIGDLAPGSERKITLYGILEGQEKEQKVLNAESGVARKDDERTIGIVYASSVREFSITRPFLGMEILFDRKAVDQYVIDQDESVQVELAWANNLPTKIVNVSIEARLSGEALDETSVSVKDGFYRSGDNTIIWDSGTFERFSEVESGGRDTVSFSLGPRPLVRGDGTLVRNPEIKVDVTARAKRISEAGVPEEVESNVVGSIKIRSDASISERAVHHVGPFQNFGPMPPIVDKDTSYTIIWTVINSVNPLSNAVVEATLPPYMAWLGNVSPQNENISFTEHNRKVKWTLGNVRAGSGVSSSAHEVAFQVLFTPSISQSGSIPTIILPASFIARDTFTETSLSSNGRGVTTHITSDPQYKTEEGRVSE